MLAYALPKIGHPNCRRPDKVIDGGHIITIHAFLLKYQGMTNPIGIKVIPWELKIFNNDRNRAE